MSDLSPLHVPPRIADLGFTVQVHHEFRQIDLPAEEYDFSNPQTCCPLLVVMATYGAIVFGVAARPAYESGTLTDWCTFFCEHNHFMVQAMGPALVGGVPCIIADVTQHSEAALLRLRVAAIEDGKRLILLSAMAPESVWPSVKDQLLTMLDSFKLDNPKGRTVELDDEQK